MAEGTILVVCTGNICRSPLVERVLQGGLDERYGTGALLVRSAGTGALVDHPMDERAAAVLAGFGGRADRFVARRLAEPMIAEADLVLTATREHRAQVVRMHPRALKRTFTVRELADIVSRLPDDELPVSSAPADRVRELVQVAVRHRGLHLPAEPQDHDVVDPFRRDDAVYDLMRDQLATALPALLRALGAGPSPGVPRGVS
ncbi:low molecular weight phosphatase family protein [Ornithinimicrobium cerasi]|uniref:Protein-tyrosine phosphatase n=1 Tax=Ornithinimicrobium cerasi TaxID=2248773 RepID=A0A285VIE8_9MICO|nr:low molecular weight phosphatase family protein [Ornithinimicrobium cerasi]SOC53849.1 protein-tyrosine phosphatase [Ornithinimicrobium cerasi]